MWLECGADHSPPSNSKVRIHVYVGLAVVPIYAFMSWCIDIGTALPFYLLINIAMIHHSHVLTGAVIKQMHYTAL